MPSNNPFTRDDEPSLKDPGEVIDYLDNAASHPEMHRVRAAALEAFAPADGERLLDAGCGLGEVARQLGSRVGSAGSVTAVDVSERAVSVARSRYRGGSVVYTIGDVTSLGFPDGFFDGVRCERVMQHVPDPANAIKEMVRVTRPGGRVCVIDTDWSSCTGDGFEYLDEIRDSFFPENHHGSVGREARTLMVQAGLREIIALPMTLRFTSPDDAGILVPFLNRKSVHGRVPEELIARFFTTVDKAADRGNFLFTFTMWICCGKVAHTDTGEETRHCKSI